MFFWREDNIKKTQTGHLCSHWLTNSDVRRLWEEAGATLWHGERVSGDVGRSLSSNSSQWKQRRLQHLYFHQIMFLIHVIISYSSFTATSWQILQIKTVRRCLFDVYERRRQCQCFVQSDPSSPFPPCLVKAVEVKKDQSHWRICVISSRWACLIFVKASSFWRFRMGPRGGMAPGGMSVWIREDGRRASERLESDEVLCSMLEINERLLWLKLSFITLEVCKGHEVS